VHAVSARHVAEHLLDRSFDSPVHETETLSLPQCR
jgi:hypothetical protein